MVLFILHLCLVKIFKFISTSTVMFVKVFVDYVRWQKFLQNIEFNFMIYLYYMVSAYFMLAWCRLHSISKVMNRHCIWLLEKLPWKQTKKNGLSKWNWKLIELSNPSLLPQAVFTMDNKFTFLECLNDRLMEWTEFVWANKLFISHKWKIRYQNVYCYRTHRVTAQKKKRKRSRRKHWICFLVHRRKKVLSSSLMRVYFINSFRSRNRFTSWFPSAKYKAAFRTSVNLVILSPFIKAFWCGNSIWIGYPRAYGR